MEKIINNYDCENVQMVNDVIFDIKNSNIDESHNIGNNQYKEWFKLQTYPRPEKYTGQCNGLRSVKEIPLIFRPIFSEFQHFNAVQSIVFDDIFYTTDPLIVSAPTGSGKTVIFELAILKLLMHLEDINYKNNFNIIYVAPVKALCSEKLVEWKSKFEPLGIECIAITGDSNLIDLKDILQYKIILTTPEKWDSITRKWRDCENIVESIKLFMIDEVHLLNEDKRGPILEAIVSRMKTIQIYFKRKISNLCDEFKLFNDIRFIAASATIPNIEDVACWLGNKDVKFHRLPDELRPVKLEKHILGFNCLPAMSGFRFDMSLNYKLSGVIQKFYNGKPILIFCSTRKGVEMAAKVLQTNLYITFNDNQKLNLPLIGKKFRESKLNALIGKGISYHHAGLCYEDRNLIENSFRSGQIPILLCTNTLAMGVNFPAHVVIVKSTETYAQGRCLQLSDSSILQMIGRAGRPQFDQSAIAIIMTQSKNVKKYENLVSGTAPIESHLHKHLAEHLNSEFVLSTIGDLSIAMEWIRSTFLYVRAIKNPINYGLAAGMMKEKIEKKLEEMCVNEINELEKFNLITKDKLYGVDIKSTQHGRLMARYYLSFETIKLFKKIKGTENLKEIFNIIIYCHEFSDFHLRVSDKRTLNELNKNSVGLDVIRFPINGKIKNIADKTSCLLQALLGNLNISDSSLSQESIRLIDIADRIAKCLIEYLRCGVANSNSNVNNNVGNFKAVLSCCILAKCFHAHLWENSIFISKQLKKIGTTYSKILAKNQKISFVLLKESDPRELEYILKKAPPFGNDIIDAVTKLPQFVFRIETTTKKHVRIQIKQINDKYLFNVKSNSNNNNNNNNNKSNSDEGGITIIIGDSKNNILFFNDNVQKLLLQNSIYERTFKVNDELTESDGLINAYLIHQSLVGIDQMAQLSVQHIGIVDSHDFNSNSIITNNDVKKTKSKKSIKTKSTPSNAANNDELLNSNEDHFQNDKTENLNKNENNQFKRKLGKYTATAQKMKTLKTYKNNEAEDCLINEIEQNELLLKTTTKLFNEQNENHRSLNNMENNSLIDNNLKTDHCPMIEDDCIDLLNDIEQDELLLKTMSQSINEQHENIQLLNDTMENYKLENVSISKIGEIYASTSEKNVLPPSNDASNGKVKIEKCLDIGINELLEFANGCNNDEENFKGMSIIEISEKLHAYQNSSISNVLRKIIGDNYTGNDPDDTDENYMETFDDIDLQSNFSDDDYDSDKENMCINKKTDNMRVSF